MKYVLVKTDNTVEVVDIEEKNFLHKCYELINCSFIEIATPNYGRSDYKICLDECGKLNDQHFNRLATYFYGAYDLIFGNILVGKAGLNIYGEYDFIGLDDEEIQDLVNDLNAIKLFFF